MRVLLVKTSSLGDVIHNLPVASDIAARFPGVVIDWAVEEGFADIPCLHPAVARVIPVALRRWRKHLLARETWVQWREFRRVVRHQDYDIVIDSQGLLKSALVARQARGRHAGYGVGSAREPLAARFYDECFEVPKTLHAVERNRQLAAQALGYKLDSAADYGLQGLRGDEAGNGAVLLTATSRDDKLWPEEHWMQLGMQLAARGLECLLPAGTERERERAMRIAAGIPQSRVLPPSGLAELATTLANARLVVGVDTGLVHLAAALETPCIALFRASDPGLTGVYGNPKAINLGQRGAAPDVDTVLQSVGQLL